MLRCLTPHRPLKKQGKTILTLTLTHLLRLSPLLSLLDPSDPSRAVPGQALKSQSWRTSRKNELHISHVQLYFVCYIACNAAFNSHLLHPLNFCFDRPCKFAPIDIVETFDGYFFPMRVLIQELNEGANVPHA